MKQIIRFRWLIAAVWVFAAVSLFIFAPNLQELVQKKGQISVPDDYTSQEASKLIESMSQDEFAESASTVLVYHDDDGLNKADKAEIAKAIDVLRKNQDDLGISNIMAFSDDPRIADETVSEDGKTIIIPFQLSLQNQKIEEAQDKIYETVKKTKIDHYLTGEQIIQQDIIDNSQDGLKKTEFITVGLILIILFIVFKSFVAPFIPLLTVGISYLAAQGIVSVLADSYDFPLSTFTQIFMVAVMFGIGTDYCILLISRFKEEITNQDTITDAVLATYKSGGKTIFYAGLAVLIGFSTIGLSTFTLYQSAVAVAVGVGVVLAALLTLVPFFLVLLGNKVFWPFDKNVSHKESRLWEKAGKFAWKRPVIVLIIVAAVVLPFVLTYDAAKSYNSLDELGDNYDSVKGFNWIADSFGPGQTMPTTIVMKTDKPIESAEDFQAIDDISERIAEMDGVDQVRSATRPAGNIIDDFLASSQTDLLADGINQSTDGLTKIQEGLEDGAAKLKKSGPQLQDAQKGVDKLMKGTQDANHGVGDIKNALIKIQQGIQSGAQGTNEIKSNLQTVKDNLDKTIAGNKQLLQGYQSIENGLKEFGTTENDTDGIKKLKDALNGSKKAIEAAIENVQQAENKAVEQIQPADKNAYKQLVTPYETAIGQMKGSIKGIDGSLNGITQLMTKLGKLADTKQLLTKKVIHPLTKLNNGLKQSISGQEQLSAGIGKLINGISQLQSGLNKAADGQGQVVHQIPDLQNGLSKIYGGQKELKTAFRDMQEQLNQLSGGLSDSSNGLKKVNQGLSSVKDILNEFNDDAAKPVVIIPKQALQSEEFMEGTKAYLSDDKTLVKFEVVLSHNPYSADAIHMIDKVKNEVDSAKKDTIFAKSNPKIGGVSSTNNDLQHISDADYSRTVFLMIAGIFIILVILLRSLIIPLYLIGSLILTYYTSMGLTELIFTKLFGFDGLTWAIPFFAFVMLMALGIDYSIFLMDRFNEGRTNNIKESLIHAMKNMGTVIISAAIILGGTFGAMLPSGVLSLLEIATAVLAGLFLYAFVMLPLFVPVMVRIFGKASWWPFKHDKK